MSVLYEGVLWANQAGGIREVRADRKGVERTHKGILSEGSKSMKNIYEIITRHLKALNYQGVNGVTTTESLGLQEYQDFNRNKVLAFAKLRAGLPDGFKVDIFDISLNKKARTSVNYGVFMMKVTPTDETAQQQAPVEKNIKMSTKTIYERNKKGRYCVNCGGILAKKDLLDSTINYCERCCG